MAMLAWAITRLRGGCSPAMLDAIATELERDPLRHQAQNFACFAVAAASTVGGVEGATRFDDDGEEEEEEQRGGGEEGGVQVRNGAAGRRLVAALFNLIYQVRRDWAHGEVREPQGHV